MRSSRPSDSFPAPQYDVKCYLAPHPGELGTVGRLASKLKTLRQPYSYVFSPTFRQRLEVELATGFDVLHLEILFSGWLGLRHRERSVVNTAFLYQLDLADQPAGTLAEQFRRHMSFRAERYLLRRFPHQIAVSPRLVDVIRTSAPGSDVRAIPFGLDFSLYPMLETETDATDRPPTLGLIASFNWTPGLTAGRRLLGRLWPAIRRRLPEARLHLAGVDAQGVFRDWVGQPGVTIEGKVTDVPTFFRGIDIQLYAPNASSGMKFKVLESFAFGVPVVTTPAGVEGIPAVDGVHAGVCLDDDGLVERTVALLTDPGLRQRQRLAARSLVEAHCDPGPILDQVEQVYADILASAPSRPRVHGFMPPAGTAG